MFLLRCPKCKHDMKYQPTEVSLKGKTKRCVYCGKTYQVSANIVKQL